MVYSVNFVSVLLLVVFTWCGDVCLAFYLVLVWVSYVDYMIWCLCGDVCVLRVCVFFVVVFDVFVCLDCYYDVWCLLLAIVCVSFCYLFLGFSCWVDLACWLWLVCLFFVYFAVWLLIVCGTLLLLLLACVLLYLMDALFCECMFTGCLVLVVGVVDCLTRLVIGFCGDCLINSFDWYLILVRNCLFCFGIFEQFCLICVCLL